MQSDEKKKLVEKLVDLTVRDLMSESDRSMSTGKEFSSRMRKKFRQEQIDLRLKHFESEQIRALLNL
jgi:hypothetical protein